MLAVVTITRLEKAATDNGFDLDLEHTADWLSFGSSQTSMRIWLTAIGESWFLAAASRADVLDGLAGLGAVSTDLLPGGAAGALGVSEIAALHRLLRRAFQLSRTLPDGLLHVFEAQTANLPRTTEAERLVVQRVGQDIFRRSLLEYRDGRCAITGLDRARSPAREPHQAMGRMRHGRLAPRRLRRAEARASSRRSDRLRLYHDRSRRNGAPHRALSLPAPGRRLDSMDR